MKKFILFFAIFIISTALNAQSVSTFENLALPPDTFWNGSDLSGGFSSGHGYFENVYDTSFGGFWDHGFIYSDKTDSTTSGFANQYSAVTGGGYHSANYAIAYYSSGLLGRPVITLNGNAAAGVVNGFYVTNSTYAYRSMLNGDQYEHAFMHTDSTSDWFKLTIFGWHQGVQTSDSVEVYLADFRSDSASQQYILHTWQWVNLLPLGPLDSLSFYMLSSQSDSFGSFTPTYFCMDNFTTGDMADMYVTINYQQDTIIHVLNNLRDTLPGPLTVQIVSGPLIPGASAIVDSAQNIYYIPTIGVVAVDTVTYSICDTAGNCSEAQIIINILPLVQGIKQIGLDNISFSPNPCTSQLTIKSSEELRAFYLYDEAGKLIMRQSYQSGQNNVEINTETLASGIYVVKMLSNVGSSFAKVIKE